MPSPRPWKMIRYFHSTVLTNPPGHLWREKWTALSGPLSQALFRVLINQLVAIPLLYFPIFYAWRGYILHPNPLTLNPKTLNPKSETRNPKPETRNPKPETLPQVLPLRQRPANPGAHAQVLVPRERVLY